MDMKQPAKFGILKRNINSQLTKRQPLLEYQHIALTSLKKNAFCLEWIVSVTLAYLNYLYSGQASRDG